MKTLLKIFVAIVLILVLAAGGVLIYLTSSFPKVGPAADITIESTPERIARGKYLAQHVVGCIGCHSTRNWDYFAGPIVPGTEGKGGERFGEEAGLPDTFYAGNITPSGIGDWTDGEIVRTITSGVNKNGKALFPLMPYLSYSKMSEEDVYAVVAYIKTLKPIANEIPARQLNFPMNLIVRTIPQPYIPRQRPNISDTVAYGEYMTTIGGCASCHTPQEKGKPIEGLDFAGGFEFVLLGGQVVRSSNITPDIGTGIGSWSKENFIGVFKSFASFSELVEEDGDNTTMPWLVYAGMTEADLGAIYTYLRTLKPVKHKVEKYSDK